MEFMLGSDDKTGQRLLTQVLDYRAKVQPDGLFAKVPLALDDHRPGWREVTYRELAHAVDYTAWWVERSIGVSEKAETLTYMGANDIRYIIITLACLKTGHSILLPSTRNAVSGQLYLLHESACKEFIYSTERKQKMEEIKQALPELRVWQIPSLSELFETETKPYPSKKTYSAAEDEPAVIIHSSGSTGNPKLIPLTNGYLGVVDSLVLVPPSDDGRNILWGKMAADEVAYCVAPLFHFMGFFFFLKSLFHKLPFVLALERQVPPETLASILSTTKPTITVFPPSIIEDLSRSEAGINALKGLRTVVFGGAPLGVAVGDRVSKITKLVTAYGASEMGICACLPTSDSGDWKYIEFLPWYGLELQEVEDGLYEAVQPRGPSRRHHGVFHSFPELQEYRSNDLFSKHPTKPGLWWFGGRKDDVIVLSNGEKFNPTYMEKVIEEHPAIRRAVISGANKFYAVLLLDPDWAAWDEARSDEELIEEVWPFVEQANAIGPAHGRISRSKIGVASKDMPFKVTEKGNVQRRAVLRDYSNKIEEIYAQREYDEFGAIPENASLEEIQAFVAQVVAKTLDNQNIQPSSDLFILGVDSLQTLQIARVLQEAVRPRAPESHVLITAQRIYANPKIAELSMLINDAINGDETADLRLSDKEDRSEKMDALVGRYTKDLPVQPVALPGRLDKHTVILTGSTGSIGNYVLELLLKDSKVEHVYCLDRAADARARHKESFLQKGLDYSAEAQAKVEAWQADFSKEKFGLEDNQFETLRSTVDTIIHNAWPVNFNLNLDHFERAHIAGTRRLVDFSLSCTTLAHIHFISSEGTIANWTEEDGPVIPETVFHKPSIVTPTGYGSSKAVAERILAIASEQAGIPTSILRVGQISGPRIEKGVWNPQEWIPTLVQTSKALAKVPSTLAYFPINWIPVDSLAHIIMEIIETRRTTQQKDRCEVFNLVNPTETTWSSLLPAIQGQFPAQVVSFQAWVDALASTEATPEEIARKPALKLLEFFRGLATIVDRKYFPIDTKRTEAASETMRNLPPMNKGLMGLYLNQWGL